MMIIIMIVIILVIIVIAIVIAIVITIVITVITIIIASLPFDQNWITCNSSRHIGADGQRHAKLFGVE